MTELRGVTCHMGSHSVICHPTQVNAPRLNPGVQSVSGGLYRHVNIGLHWFDASFSRDQSLEGQRWIEKT